MNKIRVVIGGYFQSPMSNMNFPAYMNYVNTAGKITARSTMDLATIMFTVLEEQEKINEQNEENFKQIFEILAKLVNPDVSQKIEQPILEPSSPLQAQKTPEIFKCEICGQQFGYNLTLAGHLRRKDHQPKI